MVSKKILSNMGKNDILGNYLKLSDFMIKKNKSGDFITIIL